jgi:hypothetical protein
MVVDSLSSRRAVPRHRSRRRRVRRGAAKEIEHVSGKLLPFAWGVGERDATAVASAHALEAEPPLSQILADGHVTVPWIDVPHLPLTTIAVSKDP